MFGIPLILAQETPLAQDSRLQTWFSNWLGYLSDNLPAVFLVLAILVGTLLLVRGGGIKQAVSFAIGAALVFLLLTNLEAIAAFLGEELPMRLEQGPPAVERSPAE